MKKIFVFFSLLIFILNYTQVKENLVIPKNPKIGLSLAGGGAKGFAHVGVLKVLDSLGIKEWRDTDPVMGQRFLYRKESH